MDLVPPQSEIYEEPQKTPLHSPRPLAESEGLMDELTVDNYLVFQENGRGDIKSGSVEALIVYATYSKSESIKLHCVCALFNYIRAKTFS